MSSRLSQFSVMRTLVKREFQEHRALLLYLPLVVSLLIALLFAANIVRSYLNDEFVFPYRPVSASGMRVIELSTELKNGTVLQFAAEPEYFRAIILDGYYSVSTPLFMMGYWGVMSFYFLMTMYQQRKNRSILFWNSMPVSDAQTIISKLLAGLIVSQAVYLACLLFLQVFMLVAMLAYGSLYNVDVWQTFFVPFNPFSSYFTMLGHAALTLLWTLPVYTWLLLASAASRSMPFAWAAGPLVVVVVIELLLTQTTAIGETVVTHVVPWLYFSHSQLDANKLPDMVNLELALSTVLGLALVYAAIRFNRSEDV